MDGNDEKGQQESGQEENQEQEEIVTPPASEPAAETPAEPEDPNAAPRDPETGLLLDRRTNKPLRDQDPGVPNSSYVGKHNVDDADDIADGIKKR